MNIPRLVALFAFGSLLSASVSAQTTRAMPAKPAAPAPAKYSRTPTGFLLVLHPGDNVLRELEQLARREKIPSASLTGLGFGHPTFGFWNAQIRTYAPKAFRDLEMASLTGSIAWKDDQPALHLHGVGADQNFATYGGHLLALEVAAGSMELHIVLYDKKLTRVVDESTGAAVLQVR